MFRLQLGNGLVVLPSFNSETPERTENHGLLAIIGQMATFITVNIYNCTHANLTFSFLLPKSATSASGPFS
jgi:hypothetical protein